MLEQYLSFCDRQQNRRAYWFVFPLVTISTIVMPIGAAALSYTDYLIPYIAASILSFYTNVLASVAQFSIQAIIHTYIATILFHLIILLTYLILLL